MQETGNPLWAQQEIQPHHPPGQQQPFHAETTPESPVSMQALAPDPCTTSRSEILVAASKEPASSRHMAIARRVTPVRSAGIITAKNCYKEGTPKRKFSTGPLQCMSNCSLCCVGLCCLPCLYGDNHSRVYGNGCMSSCLCCLLCPCFACCFAAELRLELRGKYGLLRDHNDFLLHTLCSPCAICQEARELLALKVGMEGV